MPNDPRVDHDCTLRYAREITANGDDSLSRIARRIPAGARVLDVGTGPGALGEFLSERGCIVDGIEPDASQAALARHHYRTLFQYEADAAEIRPALGAREYDVVVLADVLEHMRDPGRALDQLIPAVRPGGRVLVSVPNVGYAGVIAALLDGEFTYAPTGLLDETHVRFFTRRSLLHLLSARGLGVVDMERVSRPLHESEFRGTPIERLSPTLFKAILAQPEALTYQFVVEAVPGAAPALDLAPGEGGRATFGVRLYWRTADETFDELRSAAAAGAIGLTRQTLRFDLPRFALAPAELRLDIADRPGFVRVHSVQLVDADNQPRWSWTGDALSLSSARGSSQLSEFCSSGARWWLSGGADPWVLLPAPAESLQGASGGAVLVSLDWPLSGDAFAVRRVFDDQIRQAEGRVEELRSRCTELESRAAAADARATELARLLDVASNEQRALAVQHGVLSARLDALSAQHDSLLARVEASALTPLRRGLMAARRLVRPRRFTFALDPDHSLSVGSFVRLRHGTNRHPTGWVEVDVSAPSSDGGNPGSVLRASARRGGQPDVTIPLPPATRGRSRAVVKLPDVVADLTLEGSAESVSMRELSRPLAAFKLAGPLVPRYAARPDLLVGLLSESWSILRDSGWPVLKRRFRDAASSRLPSGTSVALRRAVVAGPHIGFLTMRLKRGYGVDIVVAEQVEHLCARGYEVTVIVLETDGYHDARLRTYVDSGLLRVVQVGSPEQAAQEVVSRKIRVAVAETPPFFDALDLLPDAVIRVLFDHGEPPAHLFEDSEGRRRTAERKIAISRKCDLSVAISRFISQDSGVASQAVCFNGNDHLLRRRSDLLRLAGRIRHRHSFGEAFVVLNVTRFLAAERRYKGVEEYAAVRDAFLRLRPDLRDGVRFVIAGRSEAEDHAWAERRGLTVLSNLSDEDLVSAYLDADLYLTTSQWEGYNLGLAQALALGVPALASARGAHVEFPVPVDNDPDVLARWIAERVDDRGGKIAGDPLARVRRLRSATVYPWRDAAHSLESLLRSELERRGGTSALPPKLERRSAATRPELSILILNKDKPELIERCVRSIEEHCDIPFEILIGDTGSTDPDTLRFYETTPHDVHYLGYYHFSSANNVLAARARSPHLLFLNNDTAFIETRFRDAIDYLSAETSVGCLGAYLVYSDRRIQHAGVRLCTRPPPYHGIPEHFDRLCPIDGYPGLRAPRDVLAVTGAMLLVTAEDFARMGGFDEVYEEEAQDIDLCLRMRQQGRRSVVHPALLAYHYENSTRTVKEAPRDRAEFLRRFRPMMESELFSWQERQGLTR